VTLDYFNGSKMGGMSRVCRNISRSFGIGYQRKVPIFIRIFIDANLNGFQTFNLLGE